jgi:hypothetical protein
LGCGRTTTKKLHGVVLLLFFGCPMLNATWLHRFLVVVEQQTLSVVLLLGFKERNAATLESSLSIVTSARNYRKRIRKFQRGFQTHLIALASHAKMQGVWLVSGLQLPQVYLIFLRCSSLTTATTLSSRSINSICVCNALFGQAITHLPHPLQ